MDRLSGAVEEIRFRNDENGWTVLTLEADDGEFVTVAGALPPVTPGDTLELDGEFVIHPRFGAQFKATRASVAQPKTEYGIMRFLASGLIEGCGEKIAARIVERFGKETIEIFEHCPERLAEVKGISKAKALKMSEAFAAVRDRRDAIMFLAGFGITVNLALKLYAVYGASTVEVVKTNPYVLVEDVDGVGFLTADKIAQSIGIDPHSEFRMRAGVIHSLKTVCEKEGNTYLPRPQLTEDAKKLLGLDDETALDAATETLLTERKLVCPFDDCLMLRPFYHAEKSAAVMLVKRIDEAGTVSADINGIIDRFEKSNSIELHARQREAVVNAVCHGVSVITGGPGTGKTTIIKCILFALDALGKTSLLLAPTGRAAKRITEGCGRDASTIHRAIMARGDGSKFPENVVIVDEFSMVDIFLFKMLLDAMNPEAKLIAVGDADQLPSVGAGNVLRDLIASGIIPVTRLDFIYRQSETSRIAFNAHEINAGRMPELSAKDGDFFFFRMGTAQQIADMTVELATKRITDFCGIEPPRIQVIAALKNGVAGVYSLNTRLQAALNGGSRMRVTIGDIEFATGDRVMHTVNNYELEWTRGGESGHGVFNGDIGLISFISATGDIEVAFEDGRRALYTNETRKQLILSYAVTVHKSQGSEFDAIVMPIVGGSPVIMTRNLLYTAITRAKKMAVLVGDEYNVRRMVENNYVAERFSALAVFIADAQEGMRRLYGE